MHCCPACDSEDTRWTGELGNRTHAECRDCGMRYSYITDEDEDEDELPDCDDSDDGQALASAGWGTDEDYGYFGGDD